MTDEVASHGRDRVGRAAAVITVWNLVSRLSGFVRVVATASALGIATLGDTYQRTNQVSNVLFELLAGGMLFSVLVPSFVEELQRGSQRARDLAGALATRGVLLLGVVVTLGLVARRPLIELLSSAAGESSRQAQVDLGVFLLWFVLPQLLLYGAGAVVSALLQADQRFAAVSMAPVVNNVIVTATMVAFAVVHDPARGLALTGGEKFLLGGGTLIATAAMTVVPFTAASLAGLGLRPRWRAAPGTLGALARRGLWGAGHVGVNQVLLLVTVVLAGQVDGGVIAYQTAFSFFLLPHALLAHPIFTALYPRLAREGAAGDLDGFGRDLRSGLRAITTLLAPAAAVLAVVAAPALSLVRLGQLDADGTRLVALVLAAYLVGAVGYSAFFLLTRASYALGDARSPTLVNLTVTSGALAAMALVVHSFHGTAVLVAFGLVHAVSTSTGSLLLLGLIRRRTGRPVGIAASVARAAVTALAAGAAALAVTAWIGWESDLAAAASTVTATAAGTLVAIATLVLLRAPEIDLVRPRVAGLRARVRRRPS